MEVKIVFDTEKESIEELEKLIVKIQDIIRRREEGQKGFDENLKEHDAFNRDSTQPSNGQPKKTDGGCQIIPFVDMSETMEKIFSGK